MRIDINGEIVGNGQKFCDGDFCPQDFRDAIENLNDNEQVDIHITSPGGSVIDGNVIVSLIKELQANGHKVNSYIHGIAASMASVIACACDELHIDSNAVMMIHLPWSCVQGNSNDMKKEAALLDMMTKTLVSIYKTKFNKSEDEIVQMLSQETWILGEEANSFGLDCVVDNSDSERLMIAAKYTKIYKNIPRGFIAMERKEEEKKVEEPTEEVEKTETVEPTTSVEETPEKPTEEVVEEEKKEDDSVNEEEEKKEDEEEKKEDEEVMNKEEVLSKFAEYEKQIEELTKENEELKKKLTEMETPDEEKVTKEECEKRVSGMQASMQKQINDTLHQIKAKDEEIRTVRAELSSLTSKLEEATKELTAKSSALVEKENALATLNAGVNALCEDLPTMKDGLARCSTPAEKVAFLKSGKFVR